MNTLTPTSEYLVKQSLAGDRNSFSDLVAMHTEKAISVARRVLGNDVAVDDVIQESFMKAYKHLAQLSDPSIFSAWLGTIVRNQAITWLRFNARVSVTDSEVLKNVPEQEREEEDPLLDSLKVALVHLAPKYREILRMKYEESLDYENIASRLGINVSNVEKRLYRARQALIALLPGLTQ